ncbi:pentatricopeptide repeat-containing protein At2g06000 isoform X1 [Beta vulgaris subsp. vulgaris]|uniref:pentatricopeptide repeat-containing protein At2g06000 isoform X1 n=1 Tax=Beta vulgaris subsp. vulgaris TaxID=3555 RepID=UPI002036C03F|nr:pentatricopeptide repeat-containing protein At2g06000 isoform X1 [Beta vulgaris subsp. vulgaris]XP_010681080.2 pentatricopeptide repeat-containing protein At2g06000 isoform X1 [Beta vulgaris subsp. vulgaris]
MIFPLFLSHHKVLASKLASFAHFNSLSLVPRSSPIHHCREVIQISPSEPWFAKIICTLFCFQSHLLGLHSDYLAKGLTPFIAFQVVRRLDDNHKNPCLALSFFQFCRVNFKLIHTFGAFNYILRSLCQMGLHDSASLVLDWMMLDGHSLDSSGSSFLVGLFSDSGRFDIARKLLVQTKCGEMEGNPFVYNKFLSCLVRQNRVDEAVLFFNEQMIPKSCLDACTLNILIRGLCKVGQVDKAYKFFEEMVNFCLSPDVITYNTMIDGLCRFNQVDKARELLSEVRSRDGVSPDVVTYTSIISGYCKLRMMDEASFLFQEMTSNGVRPTLITFNIIIDGFGKVGDMASVSAMYEKMLSLGCQPDVVTFTSHIDGYCRKRQVDEALKLWWEMVKWKLLPNKYTFSILIIALCKENRLNEACDLLRQLKLRNDISPVPFMYNPVIDGLCKSGKVDEANLVVSEMEERNCKHDKYTFTILIIGHCMKGRMLEAIEIFNRMLSVKCTPDDITVKSLLSCLVKAGMPYEASQIKKHIALGKVELSLPSCGRNLPARKNMDIQVAA